MFIIKIFQTDVADTYSIELTDGWYSVQAHIDFEMNKLLHNGIVKVGTKLMICNAELIGAGEGIDPLEVSIKLPFFFLSYKLYCCLLYIYSL